MNGARNLALSSNHQIKTAVFWINFSPYHYARIRALSRLCDLTAIQLAGTQRLAGWEGDCSEKQTRELTLFEDSWEELGQLPVSVKLWCVLSNLKPDFVLVPGHGTLASFAAAGWCRLHGAHTILMSVSTYQDRTRKRWKEFIKGFLLRMCFDIAFPVGRRATAYLESLGFQRRNIVAGSNVVDNTFYWGGVSHLRATARPEDFELPQRYILYVGRLASEKNLDILLRSFTAYREMGGVYDLVLVGDGPMNENLHALVASRDVGRHVHITERQGAKGLLPYYAFADCFTLPSMSEPWGLVVNEAMASGLPVIVSSQCGCVADLIQHGVNGFVFNPEDASELAMHFRKIDGMSDEARLEMGRHSLEIVTEFSLEKWANQVKMALTSVRINGCSSTF